MKLFTLTSMAKFLSGEEKDKTSRVVLYDRTLIWLALGLLLIGFVMVTSASMPIAQRTYDDPFYFTKRDGVYIVLAFVISFCVLSVPMIVWQKLSTWLLLLSLFLLVVVLAFGHSINGASRWISVAGITIQPAELSKIALFCYLSNYLVRKVDEVRSSFWGFFKPMGVMLLLAVLLLAQPDLGTVVVLFITTLGVLFLAGAKLWQFIAIILSGLSAVGVLILVEPYRIKRVTSFWDPSADPYGSGYQLTQSRIAFGQGGLFGEGLGNSVQKLEYLPEAHTDFIFSIIGEELGFIGVALVLFMLCLVAFRALSIGRRALESEQRFSGFLACAIGIWFIFQAFVNVGATTGILPTKGLTLPLISYGGSSLLIMQAAVALLLRIDYETKLAKAQAHLRT